MVGNDVIDLRDPDADLGSYSPRYVQRVFALCERRAIASDADPERCHWRYWAAKEAVYKVLRNLDAEAVFSPRCLEVAVQRGEPQKARVVDRAASPRHGSFLVRFFGDDCAVHAVTVHPEWNAARLIHGFERSEAHDCEPEAAGRAVRRLACQRIASTLGLRREDLEVRKRGRVPVLFDRGHPVAGNLSLSHHGAWSGFAFDWDASAEEASP